ncbi:HAD family hydrolase [Nannocystis sp. SCPEA4]|uniref:HAD family hydrolase n=1 Tax=Nannocystis sp. SCPEA4 TaxID=2996787 RepID=UPI002270EE1D|nr:HAD family hydrolase [Nannocystis sp. SCPEA4]MCY1055355.1 HAD family hydrolase [Nannocystis sp. SCPEA4]
MASDGAIAGVVFDLDGTLYDKRPVERWVLARMLPSLPRLLRYTKVRTSLAGVDFDDAGALAQETLQRLAGDARGQETWRRWIAERYEPQVLRAVARAGRAYPGVADLLLRLRGGGLRLGLVSDYRGAHDRLRALGIDPGLFHFSLVTEEHGAMKPAARMAARTLAGMELPGERMVMVGDRAFADQRFAETCGMRFFGVLAGGDPPDPAWTPWSGVRARLSALLR